MPNPKIQIEITANSTGYTKATNEVRQESRRLSSEMREHSLEARHGIHLVTEEFGIHMPRALQGFVAKLPGVTSAMSAAFNTIAVVALISVLVEAGKKLSEFIDKNREAVEKNREAWSSIHDSIETANDALQVANDKLANSIAKFEGTPQNGLKLAIDEAIESANKLGNKLNEDIAKIGEVLKGQQAGFMSRLAGNAGTSDISEKNKGLQEQLRDVDREEREKLAGLRNGGASQSELSRTQAEFDARRKHAIDATMQWQAAQLAAAQRDMAPDPRTGLRRGGPNQAKRIAQLQDYGSALGEVSDSLQLGIDNRDLTAQNAKDEAAAASRKAGEAAARKAKEEAAKRSRELSSIIAGTISDGQLATHGEDRVTEALKAGYHEYTQQRLEDDKRVQAAEKEQTKEYIAGVRSQRDAQKDLISIAQRRMQDADREISRSVKNGDMSERDAYQARRGAVIAETTGTTAALGAQRDLYLSIGKVDEAKRISDRIDEVEREGGERLVELHEQYSDQIRQKWMQALDGINSQIATWVTGGKTNWSGMAKGEANKLTQGALKTGEHALMSRLGIGGKSDGSRDNPFYVRSADPIAGAAGKSMGQVGGSILTSALGKLPGGGFLKGIGSIFGHALGGFALGGDVLQSGVYNTGEQGPEQVYLPRGSHVVPHSAGGSPTYVIDARGTDAALVAAHTEAAMRQTHSQAVHDAGRAMAERQRRVPQG